MQREEWIDDGDEFSDSQEYEGPAWYVIDGNGIVAGPFDDDGEAAWWISKSFRV